MAKSVYVRELSARSPMDRTQSSEDLPRMGMRIENIQTQACMLKNMQIENEYGTIYKILHNAGALGGVTELGRNR